MIWIFFGDLTQYVMKNASFFSSLHRRHCTKFLIYFSLKRSNETMKNLHFSMLSYLLKKFCETFQSNFFKLLKTITLCSTLLTCSCFPKSKNVFKINLHIAHLVYIYKNTCIAHTLHILRDYISIKSTIIHAC